jgi:hypothetical protein
MTDPARFRPYDRRAYLGTVAAKDRPTAERLCALLEQVFPAKDIVLYTGFPIVVRDGEWLAGFAMRKKCPMIYCCSPRTLEAMGRELAPLMTGRACLELRAKGGLTIEDAFDLVGRAFAMAATGPGMISEADRRRRDVVKRASPAPTMKRAAAKADPVKRTPFRRTSVKKGQAKKAAAKKAPAKKAPAKRAEAMKPLGATSLAGAPSKTADKPLFPQSAGPSAGGEKGKRAGKTALDAPGRGPGKRAKGPITPARIPRSGHR